MVIETLKKVFYSNPETRE